MCDVPTAVLDRVPVDEAPTVQFWCLIDDVPVWPVHDPDPPLRAGDARQRPRPVAPSRRWSTSTDTLRRVLDGLRRL